MARSAAFLQALAEAQDWCEALGHTSVQGRHCRLVADPAHPQVWSANHASGVRATTPEAIDQTLGDIEAAFVHSPYRVVDADAFTPAPFVARLALEGWQEQPAVILMALEGPLAPVRSPPLEIAPVETQEDWRELRRLHQMDFADGGPAGLISPEVADGLFQAVRKKAGVGRIFLARLDGRACAKGMAIPAPGGFGIVDDVFTDPEARRQGVASALIARCVGHLREQDAQIPFLTARVSDSPKRLYARLGFRPQMLARRWVRFPSAAV